MKSWVKIALNHLKASLTAPRAELSELDWKISLSEDKERLKEHLAAFANHAGGGFIVYGVDNMGNPQDFTDREAHNVLDHLPNLCREGLEPPIVIDHAFENYGGFRLLFVHVMESPHKPVCIRGKGLDKTYIRCGSTTRPASRHELKQLLINSHSVSWEATRATVLMPELELIDAIKIESIVKLANCPKFTTSQETLKWMIGEGFVDMEPTGGGYITNLGAIAAARKISEFPNLSRKALRLIFYRGLNKNFSKLEQVGAMGYAVGFEGLIKFLESKLPTQEDIGKALRRTQPVYPTIALREFVANALIHQDFSIQGTGPLIEVYDDRVEITNPGQLLPSKQPDRLIGTQPESRNPELARRFRIYKICEERGSGIARAVRQIEQQGLPPVAFFNGPNYFKVTIFAPRTFLQMSQNERLQACLQHAALQFSSSSVLTNKSLRERLRMPEKQRSLVSMLIRDAVGMNFIKRADPDNTSSKFAEYVPYWA